MEREGDGNWTITFPEPTEPPRLPKHGEYWPEVGGDVVRPFKDVDEV